MPYYLGKVPLAAELPELAEEIRAARTDPQQERSREPERTPPDGCGGWRDGCMYLRMQVRTRSCCEYGLGCPDKNHFLRLHKSRMMHITHIIPHSLEGPGPHAGAVFSQKHSLSEATGPEPPSMHRPALAAKEYGSCFGDLLPEGVFTYFGCGRNTTSVHYDAHETLGACWWPSQTPPFSEDLNQSGGVSFGVA